MKMLLFKTLENTTVELAPDYIFTIEHKSNHIEITSGTETSKTIYKTLKAEKDTKTYQEVLDERFK